MQERPNTRITDVRLIRLRTERQVGVVEPAWDPGGTWPLRIGGGSYVEVRTDAGLVGIGPGCNAVLLPALREQLVGKDPFDIERHDAVLGYYAAGLPYEGTAGVDIALWDVIGKLCGQPLYKLWGGGRDRVVPYASLMRLSTPEERAQQAAGLRQAGWRALKVRLHHQTMQEDIRTVEAVREAVGDDMAIMVDANQAQSAGGWQPGVRWDFRRAVETARVLQTLRCTWLEEPLPRFAFDQLAELRRRVELPIAGGENNTGLHEFRHMLQNEVYDILQPECLVLEGISTVRKIGVLAGAFGKQVVPHHGAWDLGLIAHLHFVASCPHAPYLEILHDPPIGDYRHGFAVLQDPPAVGPDGCLAVPQAPGLGVELRQDLIEAP
jgi:L-alanine-DL-glutamate epimerase-like enolase superfamily enzyme